MPGVGIGQQHGVREMLAQHVRIANWNHVVEDPVDDEAWLIYFAERGEAFTREMFPGTKRLDLSHGNVLAG